MTRSFLNRYTRGYLHRDGGGLFQRSSTNVNRTERIISIASAALILAATLWRRRRGRASGLAATTAGLLLERGLSGRCATYNALGVSSA
jgi:hypothetical protein